MNKVFPAGGYHKKLLRVNLTTGVIQAEEIPVEVLKSYIGGTGLGIYLLYSQVPTGALPLGPENNLIFATGPFTGSLVPGSGTYSVMCKSPLTGYAASAQANGFFGARLKAAGFDALVVQGYSEKKVYLYIDSSTAVLKSSDFLKNRGAFETDKKLRARHNEKGYEQKISIACIGPAGENQVRFAAISSDRGHMAASGGVGAVMGSKNLKAIVISGDGPIPTAPGKKNEIKEEIFRWREESTASGLGQTVHEKGTLGLFKPYHDKGWVPVKNMTTNQLSEDTLAKFDWEYIRNEVYEKVPRACHACTFTHCHTVRVKKGPSKDFIGEEIEYEILAGYGSNWGISDPGTITMLNGFIDDLGMDAKEVSFLISMLMEGRQKGLISKGDLDGIDLTWGNVNAVKQLLERISLRKGMGDVLADGIVRTVKALGKGFDKIGVFVKQGNAPHVHDSRTRWGTLFTQVISNTSSQEGVDMTGRGNPELGITKPTADPDTYLAEVQTKTGPKRQFEECLAFCYFQACSLKQMVQTLNVITGADFSAESCLKIGERVINLLRMYNIREGLSMEDDSYSHRLGQSPTDGPGKGKSLNSTFNEVRQAYYEMMGWDNRGVPTAKTLERLNLTFSHIER